MRLVQVEADAFGNCSDHGGGVVTDKEKRVWWKMHEAGVEQHTACMPGAGWQAVRGAKDRERQPVAGRLPVGPSFDVV